MPTHLVVWNFFPGVPFSKTRDIPGEESSLVPTTEVIVAGHDKQAAQILPFRVVQITAGISTGTVRRTTSLTSYHQLSPQFIQDF